MSKTTVAEVKVEQAELDKLNHLNRSFIESKHMVADSALAHNRAIRQMDIIETEMYRYNNELTEKYGEGSINMKTGVITPNK